MIPMGLKVLQDKNPVQYKKENNIVLTSKIVRAPPMLSCLPPVFLFTNEMGQYGNTMKQKIDLKNF